MKRPTPATSGRSRFLTIFGTGAAWGAASIGLTKAMSLVLKVLVARLGISDFGAYYFATSVFMNMATLAALGIPMSVTRFVSLYRSRGEPGNLTETVSAGTIFLLVSGGVAGIIFFIWSALPGVFGLPEAYAVYIRIMAYGFPGILLITLVRAVLFGELRPAPAYLTEITEQTGKFLLAVVWLFTFGYSVRSALTGYVAGIYAATVLVIFLPWGVRSIRLHSLSAAKPLFTYAWPVSISEILTAAANAIFLIVLQTNAGSIGVGEYAAAVTIAALFFILPQVTLPLFLPYVTSLSGSNKTVRTVRKRIMTALGIPTLILLAIVAAGSRGIIGILFGAAYDTAVPPVIILSAGYAWYAVFVWPNRQILDAFGLTKFNLMLTIARLATVTLVLTLTLPVTATSLSFAVWAGWIVESIGCFAGVSRVLSGNADKN